MNLRTAMQCAVALAVLCLGSIDARARVIDYSFTTTVDFSTFATVKTGDAFTISYSVDTAIPPSGGFQIGSMTLADFNNVSNMMMTAGSFSANAATPSLLRQIDDTQDQYLVYSAGAAGPPLEGLDIVYFSLQLFDPTGTAISDAFTALNDPSLAGFSVYAFWAVFAAGDVGGVIHGLISRPAAVPVPGTLALVGVALVVLGFSRRTR